MGQENIVSRGHRHMQRITIERKRKCVMHLQAAIVVARTNEQVWRFFTEPSNLAKWDRSVAQVILTSSEPFGVGSTFDTIAPVPTSRSRNEGMRMSYRITEYVPRCQTHIRLTNSRIFTFAEWI